MKKDDILYLHRIYGVLLSISIIIAGICLIWGCLTIYFTGERTYSREIVADTFSRIAIPIYICLAFTIIGFIFEFFFPSKPQKQKPCKAYPQMIERLVSKRDFLSCDTAVLDSIYKERRIRKFRFAIQTLLLFVGSAVFLFYALNGDNFHQSEINQSMIHAMWVLIPCMAVPFGYAIFAVYSNEKSFRREFEIIKQLPVLKNQEEQETSTTATNYKEMVLQFIIFFVGVGILLYGFASGGTIDVLTKAINICTECIGLG